MMNKGKRFTSLLLALLMMVSLCPTPAIAVEADLPAKHTEHVWDEGKVAKEATCTDEGLVVYTCECGETKEETISALGHAWGDWKVVAEATCTEDGKEERVCANCGETEGRTIEAGHVWGEWKVVAEATCTEDGKEERVCAVCGLTEGRIIEAGHAWGDWKVVAEATCTEDGKEERVCAECGETETRTITAAGHAWSDWKVVVEATCTEDGKEERVCATCGETESRVIEAAHAWGEWKVTTDPTCSAEGEETRACAECDATETRPVDKLPHTWGDWTVTVEPTLFEEGAREHTCDVCHETETEVVPVLESVDSLTYTFGTDGDKLALILGGEFDAEDASLTLRELKEHETEPMQDKLQEKLTTLVSDFRGLRLVDEDDAPGAIVRKDMTFTIQGEWLPENDELVFAVLDQNNELRIAETKKTVPTNGDPVYYEFEADAFSALLWAVDTKEPLPEPEPEEVPVVLKHQELTADVGEQTVTVSGNLPEGAELVAVAVPLTTAAAIYEAQTGQALPEGAVFCAIDVTILYNGEKYDPESFDESVKVSVSNTSVHESMMTEEAKVDVLHVKVDVTDGQGGLNEDALNSLLTQEADYEILPAEVEGSEVFFDQSSFSLSIFTLTGQRDGDGDDDDWLVVAEFTAVNPPEGSWVHEEGATTAQARAGLVFYMDIIAQNSSQEAQSETIQLTGSNIDKLSLPAFEEDGVIQYGTPVLLLTDDQGVSYYGTLSQISGGLSLLIESTDPGDITVVDLVRLALVFRPHSNGCSVSIDSDHATSGGITTVTESIINPTLGVSSTLTGDFYQWLADLPAGGSYTPTITTTPTTNSGTNLAIPYMDSVTVTQTVMFNRFALSENPAVTVTLSSAGSATDAQNIVYHHNEDGECIGYTVTVTRTSGNTGAELPMPVITSKPAIKKDKMVSADGTGSNNQIIVTSSVQGTPVNSTTAIGPANGATLTKDAKRYSVVNWTISGTSGNNPQKTETRTNLTPGTTNVTEYNITTTVSSVGNSTFFVFQGEGAIGSGKIGTNYRNDFTTELTSFQLKDKDGNVIVPDLATAYSLGMVDKVGDKYYMKFDTTTNQSYIPILRPSEGSTSGAPLGDNVYTVEVGVKTTIDLDDQNKAGFPSGTDTAVRFFMSYGRQEPAGNYITYPQDNSPIDGKAGVVTSLYIDVLNMDAELEVLKSGVYDTSASKVTYSIKNFNSSAEPITGGITDNWPEYLILKEIRNVKNTRITLYFTSGDPQVIDCTSDNYTYTGTRRVNRIDITGFIVPAATIAPDGSVTQKGCKTITIIGQTDSNTPFTVGNTVSSSGGGGSGGGGGGGSSYTERLVLSDCITKVVYSDAACTDPIEGTETVNKGDTVYFKVQVTNKSNDNLPFKIFDQGQVGMTLQWAKYNNGDNIPMSEDGLHTYSSLDETTINWEYPQVTIPGHNGVGTWVMAYKVNDNCEATQLVNKVYSEVYVGADAFRTMYAEASISIEYDHSADISLTKHVSGYVYKNSVITYVKYTGGNFPNQYVLSDRHCQAGNEYELRDYVMYEIGVTNNGPDPAPIEYIYDALSPDLTYVGIADGHSNPRPSTVNPAVTTRSRFGVYRTFYHLNPNPGTFYPTAVAVDNQIGYAFKQSLAADANCHGTTAHSALAGSVTFNGYDEEGRIRFSVKELNGDPLMIDAGEGFWFAIVCRVASVPTSTDSLGRPYYLNTAGAQSIAWAVQDEDPTKEYVEDSDIIYYKADNISLSIVKTADAYQSAGPSSPVVPSPGLTTVQLTDSIRFSTRINNELYGQAVIPLAGFEFYDQIPENYEYREGSLTAYLPDGTSLGALQYVQYDPDTNLLYARISNYTGTNYSIWQQIYYRQYFTLKYWVDPVSPASYHVDTNVAWLSTGPRSSWTTFALGPWGVVLQKSQTIRGTTYTSSTPVPVHEKEPFTYTLTAIPKYEDGYTISNITFTDELPNINDTRGSEFGVTFADPTITSDVVVKITKADNTVETIDPSYYTVVKSGYNLTVSFKPAFDAAYSAIVGACKSFVIEFPVKAEVLDSTTSSDASPLNANGNFKEARNTYNLAYTLTKINLPPIDINLHSNEVVVRTLGTMTALQAQKALQDAEDADESDKVFTFTVTAGTNTAGDDVVGDPVETPLPENPTVTVYDAGTVNFGNAYFKYAGTYNYTITETDPGSQWIVSGSPISAVVVVTEGTDGNLTVSSVTYSNSATPSSNVVTNRYIPRTSITINKIWDDYNNQDGKRSGVVATMTLRQTIDGTTTDVVRTDNPQTVGHEDGWSYTWSDLPKYNENGQTISYSVKEVLTTPNGYTIDGAADDGTYEIFISFGGSGTITNKYTPETTPITINKTWDDYNNQDGKRSDVVATMTLQKTVNGTTADVVRTDNPQTVGDEDDWSYTWTNLPKYEGGVQIQYSVKEELTTPNGYVIVGDTDGDDVLEIDIAFGGSGTITNQYTPQWVTVEVEKIWIDTGDNRPDSIAVSLKADGVEVATAQLTSPSWSYEFDEDEDGDPLPRYKLSNGSLVEIVYTVEETQPSGYLEPEYSTPVFNETTSTWTITITNTECTNVNGYKFWADGDDASLRPESVTVRLMKSVDGGEPEPVTGKVAVVEPDASGHWPTPPDDPPAWSFTDLPTVEWVESPSDGGAPRYMSITYTVEEDPVPSYTPTYAAAVYDAATNTWRMDITNTPNEGALAITKTVQNGSQTQGFSVKVTLQKNSTPVTGTFTATVTKGTETRTETVTFGALGATFTIKHNETWTINGLPAGADYTVTEQDLPNGWQTPVYTGQTGTIVASQTKTATITNNYVPGSTTLTVPVTKHLTGLPLPAEEDFVFTLTRVTANAPMPADAVGDVATLTMEDMQDPEDRTANFGTITYTAAGTFTYTVAETAGTTAGVTYDDAEYTVTVTVTDNNGNLSASAVYTKGTGTTPVSTIAFTNEYNPDDVDVTLEVKKILNGVPPTAEDFTFRLAAVGTAPLPNPNDDVIITMPGANPPTGSFGTITYDTPGEYNYTVREVVPSDPTNGMTYDTVIRNVKVTVAIDPNDSSKLTATVTMNDTPVTAPIEFTNSYTPGSTSLQIPVTKVLTGQNPPSAQTFTFTLARDPAVDPNNAPLPTNTTVEIEMSETGIAYEEFDAINYDAVGTYYYIVSEVTPSPATPGMEYNTENAVFKVTVAVTDNDGQLQATPTYTKVVQSDPDNPISADSIAFYNKYTPGPTSLTLSVKKHLDTTQPLDPGEVFTFKLEGEGDAPMPAAGGDEVSTSAMTTDDQEETKSFGEISFTEPGTFHYTVYEVIPDSPTVGMTYDSTVYQVTVVVTLNASTGQLEKTVTYNPADDVADDTMPFTNTYSLEGTSYQLPVTKKLTGHNLPSAKAFTFELEAVSAYTPGSTTDEITPIPMPGNSQLTIRITNAGTSRTGYFGSISYTQAGDYTYKVREIIPTGYDPQIWHYDDTVYTVLIKVRQDGTKLKVDSVTVTPNTNGNKVVFTNSYNPKPATLEIPVTKTLDRTSHKLPSEVNFEFTLTRVSPANAPMPSGAQGNTATLLIPIQEAGRSVEKKFGEMEFTAAGTYTYTVKETVPAAGAPGNDSMTYDEREYTVTVNVVDDGTGQLVATATYEVGGKTATKIEFINKYTPKPVNLALKVWKNLIGQNPPRPETFQFILKPVSLGAPMPRSPGEKAEITLSRITPVDRPAFAQFGRIVFRSAGTYVYTINEVVPAEGERTPGMTYDEQIYKVTVVVEDDGNGKLEVTSITYSEGSSTERAEFTNKYEPKPATFRVPVSKMLKGQNPPEELVFKFLLTPDKENSNPTPPPMPAAPGENAIIRVTSVGGPYVPAESPTDERFGEITFEQPGKYFYTVREINSGVPGVDYDNTVYTVVIVVEDNGRGQLVAKATYLIKDKPVDDIVFTNAYKPNPTEYQPQVKKTLTGHDLPEKEVFTFVLTAVDAFGPDDTTPITPVPMPVRPGEQTTITLQYASEPNNVGTAKFGSIPFTEAGTYNYTVSEIAGSTPSLGYDDKVYALTITVKDVRGQLTVVKVEVDGREIEKPEEFFFEFTNEYKPKPVELKLPVTKILNGHKLPVGKTETFVFRIKGFKDSTPPLPRPAELEIEMQGPGTIREFFKPILFTQAGTYEYVVWEVTPDRPQFGRSMTYDTSEYIVSVKIVDKGGKLIIDGMKITKISGQSIGVDPSTPIVAPVPVREIVFTNFYKPKPVSINVPVEKIIDAAREDLPLEAAASFTFSFRKRATDNIPMPANTRLILSTNGSTPVTGVFGPITYDTAGVYSYTVAEALGTIPGFTYDVAVRRVTVTVVDNNGVLEATCTVTDSSGTHEVSTVKPYEKPIQFKNRYVPEKIKVTALKKWEDEDDRDGIRPEKIVLQLWAQYTKPGQTNVQVEPYKVGEPVTITKDDEWKHTWEDLPKYRELTQLVTYWVVEEKITYVDSNGDPQPAPEGFAAGYTVTYDPATVNGDDKEPTITVTNTHIPETVNFQFTKVGQTALGSSRYVPLKGVVFALFKDEKCEEPALDHEGNKITATSDADGIVKFSRVPLKVELDPRTGKVIRYKTIYYMKEIDLGDANRDVYWDNDTIYVVTVVPEENPAKDHVIITYLNDTQTGQPIGTVPGTTPGTAPGTVHEPVGGTTHESVGTTISAASRMYTGFLEGDFEKGYVIKNDLVHYKVQVLKKNHDKTTVVVQGAAFDLYKANNPSTGTGTITPPGAPFNLPVPTKDESVRPPTYTLPAADYTKLNTASLVTGSTGKIDLGDLVPGTYYLVETAAPRDYYRLEDAVEIVVTKTSLTLRYNITVIKDDDGDGEADDFVKIGVTSSKMPTQGQTAAIVFTITDQPKYGYLRIEKNLPVYENSESATFTFNVEGKIDGNVVYSNVATLTVTAGGNPAASETLNYIPAGAHVTVTEIDSGNHYEATVGSQEIVIKAEVHVQPEDTENIVVIGNTYIPIITGGHGIENTASNDGGTWTFTPGGGPGPDNPPGPGGEGNDPGTEG